MGKQASVRGLFLAALLSGVASGQQSLLGQDRFIRQPTKETQVAPKPPLVSILEQSATEPSSPHEAGSQQKITVRKELVSILETTVPPAAAVLQTRHTNSVLEIASPMPGEVPQTLVQHKIPPTSTPIVLDSRLAPSVQPAPSNHVPASQFVWKPRGTSTANPESSASPFTFVSERKTADLPDVKAFAQVAPQTPNIVQLDSFPTVAQSAPAIEIQPTEQEIARLHYREIASGISQELLQQFEAQQPSGLQMLSNLESPPGWQAVGEQLSLHVRRCDELVARRAYLSATQEAQSAIHHLLRVLDLHGNQYQCEPLWAEAQQVLREAEDFADAQRLATDTQLLGRLIASHETQILKTADISQLSPLAAVQHYQRYAQERLVAASQGHPWASELYFTLGRCLQALSETGEPRSEAMRWRALTYYRSARDILPSNAVATNQLGYLLLKMDRAEEARDALLESVHSGGPMAAWENLVEASRRLGEVSIQDWATRNYLALRQQNGQPSTTAVQMLEVSPQQFVALSPYNSGPQPATTVATSWQDSAASFHSNPTSHVASPMRNTSTYR